MSVSAYLLELVNARSVEELWRMHLEKMAEYGFDRLFYGFTRHKTSAGFGFGDPQDFVILTNHNKEYTDRFLGERMYMTAPMVRWALTNEGALSWDWLAEKVARNQLTPQEMDVLQFNQSKGITAGYTISFASGSFRSKGAIGLIAPTNTAQSVVNDTWAEHGEDLLVMNNVAHLKLISLPHAAIGWSLTDRQREALEWVSDGKTTQDIAAIMGLTPATVEKHLRLARQALNVETTAQAVSKAAFQNQIFVLDAQPPRPEANQRDRKSR